jgi:uncharacterized protein (TIGR02118 family)
VSRDAALDYWRESHAQLVERVPGVERYVQDYCATGPDVASRPNRCRRAVVDSIATAEAALATPEWRAVIEDAATFMDLDRVTAAWVEEHPIF